MAGYFRILASSFALLVSACQAAPPPGETMTGSWGGQHIALELTAQSGRLQYDCAAGTIDEPVRPDASGRFLAHGTHTPGHGGPERIGEEAPASPADYEGRVNGGHMILSVRIPALGQELGPFTLEHGAAPNITACL